MPSASRLVTAAAAALVLLPSVLATHFRYGVITWEHVSGGSSGRNFSFTIQAAFRASYFPVTSSTTKVSTGTYFVPDSSLLGTGSTSMVLVPNVLNTNQDWFIGTQTFSYQYPSTSSGTKTSLFINCCRISSLINNHDKNWQVTAVVPVNSGEVRHSMKTTQVPITSLVLNTVNTFQLGILNYSGPLTYRIATSTEAAGTSTVASYFDVSSTTGWSAPPNFAINSNTGVITFNTSSSAVSTGLYTTQVVVTETTSSDYSTMAVDWILQVVSSGALQCKRFCYNQYQFCSANADCSNCDGTGYPVSNSVAGYPYCDTNTAPYFYKIVFGGSTTVNLTSGQSYSGSYTVQYGSTATIAIYAKDDDVEDYITLGTGTLPSGSNFSGTATVQTYYPYNPVYGLFTWNMGSSTGGIVCFTATDSYYSNIGSTCVTLTVGAGTLVCSGDGMQHATAGARTSFTCTETSGRTLSLAMTSYSSGTVSTSAGSFTISASGTTYTLSYNLTTTGYYSVEVSDVTSGIAQLPASVFSTLSVSPNVTYPANTKIFDQGTTGWTGGKAGANVSFYLTAADAFGNLQTLQRQDNFTIRVNSSAGTSGPFTMQWQNGTDSSGNQLYRYAGNYTIPSGVSNYTVCVYFAASASATAQLVSCKNLQVTTQSYVLNTGTISYTAGNNFTAQFTATDQSTNALLTTVQSGLVVTVNGVSASYTFSSGTYNVTFPNITAASVYTNGIVWSGPGLQGTAGIQTFSFTVYPGLPSAPNCVVAPKSVDVEFNALTAGDDFVVSVLLMDSFGNICNNYKYDVTATLTDSKGGQLTSYANASATKGYYFLQESVTVVGNSNLSVVVANPTSFASTFSITLSPVTLVVGPGLLSPTYSGLTSVPTLIAGLQFKLTLTPYDKYGNARKISNGDTFLVTFSRDVDSSAQTAYYAQDPTTYAYVFYIKSPYNGPHTFQIMYYIPNAGYAQFTESSVTVHAGALTNTSLNGKGCTGGYEQTLQEVIVQAADNYSNVIENTGFGYALDSSTGLGYQLNGTQAYIARVTSLNGQLTTCTQSSYCEPESYSCSYPNLSGNFSNSSLTATALSTTETAFRLAGFFRLLYYVPHVHDVPGYSSTSNATFNLSIWRFDPTTVSSGQDLCSLISQNKAVLIKQFGPVANGVAAGENSASQLLNSVVYGTLAGCMFVSAVGYGAWRLSRYRPKYLQERERANEAEGMVKDIKEEALMPGVRDYAAVGGGLVTQNPLHEANKSHTSLRADYAKEVNPAYVGGKMTEMTSPKGPSRGASLKKF